MADQDLSDFFPDHCIIPASGTTDNWGYSRLSVVKGKHTRSHRIAYRLFKGSIPHDKVVMHTCDNPPCINPKHLVLGTHSDNHADMMRKDRHCRGERDSKSKLTEADVKEILSSDKPALELADKFKVTKGAIYSVLKRRTWRHLSEEYVPPYKPKKPNRRTKKTLVEA